MKTKFAMINLLTIAMIVVIVIQLWVNSVCVP